MRDVLLVDDDERVPETIADMLKIVGFRVDAVTSGEAALACLAQRRYDVVVTDLSMPGIDGWDVARAARESRPDVTVIVVSGTLDGRMSTRDVPGIGEVRLMAKPLGLGDLESTVGGA